MPPASTPRRVLVVGLGRFGRAVVDTLAEVRGVEVIAVDEQMDPVDHVRDKVAVAARVDALEREALEALGAREVDAAVVGIGEDFEAAVLTVAVLRELGIKEIVARAQTDRRRRVLETVGATRVVMAEGEMGQRVARALAGSHVLDHLELGDGVSLIQWVADARVAGRSLAALDLRARFGLQVVAIKRRRPDGGEAVDATPDPALPLHEGDVLLLVGAAERLAAFTR
jgi:trk system potassium uptake protein TrkA